MKIDDGKAIKRKKHSEAFFINNKHFRKWATPGLLNIHVILQKVNVKQDTFLSCAGIWSRYLSDTNLLPWPLLEQGSCPKTDNLPRVQSPVTAKRFFLTKKQQSKTIAKTFK